MRRFSQHRVAPYGVCFCVSATCTWLTLSVCCPAATAPSLPTNNFKTRMANMSCSNHQLHTPVAESTIPLRTREAIEAEVRRRVDAERERLKTTIAAQAPREHFHRPVERPFTAAERDKVTILFGGLTSKHEWL